MSFWTSDPQTLQYPFLHVFVEKLHRHVQDDQTPLPTNKSINVMF